MLAPIEDVEGTEDIRIEEEEEEDDSAAGIPRPAPSLETHHKVKLKSIVEPIGLTDCGANGVSLAEAAEGHAPSPASPTSRWSA